MQIYKIKGYMRNQYAKRVESAQFFTDAEAWNLFRLAAFGEAFGWTLLISSLVFKHYITPGNNIPIDIAGQIHGTIFLIYIAAVVVLHPSLRWSPKRTLIAGLVSVPPYGTLVFEQWAAHKRRNEALKSYRQLIVRGIIVRSGKLLAVQPADSGYWYLPGGATEADEAAEVALRRIITDHTGIKPVIGHLAYVWQHTHARVQQLELFFVIKNAKDYQRIDLSNTKRGRKDLDEISFVHPAQSVDLQPKFLQTIKLPKSTDSKEAVKFI
jgi:integral membrane protein